MENSIANSGLNALATAAAEVETSQQAAESETPTAVPGSRAPQTLGATELRDTLQSLSDSVTTQLASMSRHVATLSQRMDRVERDSRPTPVRERAGRRAKTTPHRGSSATDHSTSRSPPILPDGMMRMVARRNPVTSDEPMQQISLTPPKRTTPTDARCTKVTIRLSSTYTLAVRVRKLGQTH